MTKPPPEQQARVAHLIITSGLHHVPIAGLSDDEAVGPLADHIERRGLSGELLACLYMDEGRAAWTNESADETASFMGRLENDADLRVRRTEVESYLKGLLQNGGRELFASLRRLPPPKQGQ